MTIRGVLVGALMLASMVVGPAAAEAAPLVRPGVGCIERAETGRFSRVPTSGASVDVMATPATRAAATTLARRLVALRVRTRWFGPSRLGPGIVDGPRLRMYVVRQADMTIPGAIGLSSAYCDAGRDDQATVVLIRPGLSAGETLATAGHEAFHTFQGDPATDTIDGRTWLGEATATWAEEELVADPDSAAGFDATFLGRPGLPLDLLSATDDAGPHRDHEYGAFRFIQYLAGRAGPDRLYRVMRRAFAEIAPVHEPTAMFKDQLGAEHIDLADELGRFWGLHLRGTLLNGPAASLTHQLRPGQGGTQMIDGLAASIVRVGSSPGVRRLVLHVTPAEGLRVWLDDGTGPRDFSAHGLDQAFCVRGSESGALSWPGQVRLALTNGTQAPLAATVRVDGSPDGCQGEDSPVAPYDAIGPRLPGACPAPPQASRRFDTPYGAYEDRATQVLGDVSDWEVLETQRARQQLNYATTTTPPASVRSRLAQWYSCGARRIARIQPVTRDHIMLAARNRIILGLSDAARAVRRGHFEELTRHILTYTKAAVLLSERAILCETSGGSRSLRCGR